MIHLTKQELAVVRSLSEGKSNKETAILLGISIKTVEKHRQSVYCKCGQDNLINTVRQLILDDNIVIEEWLSTTPKSIPRLTSYERSKVL